MRPFNLFICLVLIAMLVWLNRMFGTNDIGLGGLSWFGWFSIFLVMAGVGFVVILNDSARAFGFFRDRDQRAANLLPVRTLELSELEELGLAKYRGPEYPHPIIFPDRCIGCQACVDACPHDVLAIVDGRAASVAPDLCMEDTACQAECPVNPKACIVINTTKQVRSVPAPTRDGASYQTNVPGCYIIGDVSGVPLIKNAVKEGAEVIEIISNELAAAAPEPRAEIDVAVIGIGPGGASAISTAHDKKLRYAGIEQDKILATIEMYPKGKYIFFKPDTKDWTGGIRVAGLGLKPSKYGAAAAGPDHEEVIAALDPDVMQTIREQVQLLHSRLLPKIPRSMQAEASDPLAAKLEKEIKRGIAGILTSHGTGSWPDVYRQHFEPNKEAHLKTILDAAAAQVESRIPGDQRETILAVWNGNLADKGVTFNEGESCKAITRANDGDYFIVNTERGTEKTPAVYKARRVVIAIGLRGAPNKLRLSNEDLSIAVNGHQEQKVRYSLTNPAEYKGKRIAIVGGGNSAVEAAVDLAAKRVGTSIEPRPENERNQVTLLVRDYFAPTVKFGNKLQMYHCFDAGLLDLKIGVAIKEMRENELVLFDPKTGQILDTIPNDYVFALIGGERPDRFLKSIGIEIK
ncbi:MAG: NAD(P)-binding domain-containing protein [Acidobacteriota bacterium]